MLTGIENSRINGMYVNGTVVDVAFADETEAGFTRAARAADGVTVSEVWAGDGSNADTDNIAAAHACRPARRNRLVRRNNTAASLCILFKTDFEGISSDVERDIAPGYADDRCNVRDDGVR